MLTRFVLALLLFSRAVAQVAPVISSFAPAAGPEGTRIEIRGKDLDRTRAVMFGTTSALFQIQSDTGLLVLVPLHAPTGKITLISAAGRTQSATLFHVENDPRIPDEVRYKTGYVSIIPRPSAFNFGLLWGIAIADTRYPSAATAQIEIAFTQLSCRIDGREVILNRDEGSIRGALYRRDPWFANNEHEPMPLDPPEKSPTSGREPTVLRVGSRPGRVWHFWSGSGRTPIPPGLLEGCTVTARVRISAGAMLQLGMDYWRDRDSPWAPHEQNNHEAGASRWYFSSPNWQDAVFTDIPERSSTPQ